MNNLQEKNPRISKFFYIITVNFGLVVRIISGIIVNKFYSRKEKFYKSNERDNEGIEIEGSSTMRA